MPYSVRTMWRRWKQSCFLSDDRVQLSTHCGISNSPTTRRQTWIVRCSDHNRHDLRRLVISDFNRVPSRVAAGVELWQAVQWKACSINEIGLAVFSVYLTTVYPAACLRGLIGPKFIIPSDVSNHHCHAAFTQVPASTAVKQQSLQVLPLAHMHGFLIGG